MRSLTKDDGELGPLRTAAEMLQENPNTELQLISVATEIFEIDVLKEETVEAAANAWGAKPWDLLIIAAGMDTPRSAEVCNPHLI